MPLTPEEIAARDRAEQYNPNPWNSSTNPFGLAGLGYKTNWPQGLNDTATLVNAVAREASAASFIGASSSSVAIGAGPKSFLADIGAPWVAGLYLGFVSNGNNNNALYGWVTSYDPVTGVLNIDVDAAYGTGTHADWRILPAGRGRVGDQGPQGVPGPPGSGSTITVAQDGVIITATPRPTLDFIAPLTAVDDPSSSSVQLAVDEDAINPIGAIVSIWTYCE